MKNLAYILVAVLFATTFMSCEKEGFEIDPNGQDTLKVNDTITVISNPATIPYPEGVYFNSMQNTDSKDTTWSVIYRELTVGKGTASETAYTDGDSTSTTDYTLGACYQISGLNVYAFELKYKGNRTNTYLVYRTGDSFIARMPGTIEEYQDKIKDYQSFLSYCEVYAKK